MILITGANGQLGQDFQKLLDSLGERYIATDYKELDITDFEAVENFFENNRIDILINCAGYNDVDRAEKEIEKCYALNSYAPRILSEICERYGVEFITYSTDFVFDGEKKIAYVEEDIPNPSSVYSKSKLEGENYSLRYEKSFVIRTSWVFGMGNNNFCKQVINWSKNNSVLRIVDDQISSPTYSKDLAYFSWKLLKSKKYGLYHFSNSGECSKYEQAKYILERIGWSGEIQRAKTSEFNLLARRSEYTKLNSEKIERVIGEGIPDWRDGIDRFLEEYL